MYYYISLGSNIAPEMNLSHCLEILLERFFTLYLYPPTYTPPEKITTTAIFINALIILKTPLSPAELKETFSHIETDLGRDRNDPQRSLKDRPCDLDILGYSASCQLDFFTTCPEPYLQAVLNPATPKATLTVYNTLLPNRPTAIYFQRSPRHELIFSDKFDTL